MSSAETGMLDVIVGLFLFGLFAVAIAILVGVYRHDRKRRALLLAAQKSIEAERLDVVKNQEYLKRSEERTIAYVARATEHFDRVEKLLGEISRTLDCFGGHGPAIPGP